MAQFYYREIANETEVFRACFDKRLPLLIKGPTGCGKSQYVAAMAETVDRPLIKVACNEDTSASDLIGRFVIQNMETVWQDGPVTRAARTGSVLYLDEIAEAREDVVVALHALTDHRRELYIDRLNETVVAAPGFMCVASYNPGYQRGLKELKPSTRQRFVTLRLNYPRPAIEAEIVAQVTGADSSTTQKLAQFAAKIRDQPQLGLRETVSTRLLVHAAELIRAGLAPRVACQHAIAFALSDDDKTQQILVDIIALSF